MDYTVNNTHGQCIITVLCPGLAKEDIKINANKKENTLAVLGKPTEKVIEKYPDVTLDFEGKISVDKSYGVEDATKSIADGILQISIPNSKDIKEI